MATTDGWHFIKDAYKRTIKQLVVL
uniref:Uncharacterized protein n=1 Tax=Arundo donax TaxID=35708 RepID=A0A0A8YH76_ARUDO